MAADNSSVRRRCNCGSEDDDDDDNDDEQDDGGDGNDDDDDWTGGGQEFADDGRSTAAAAATAFDPLDARRLPDLLDPERLLAALDGCLRSGYVRGCVVETWDASLSDHLDAIAHLVLYQTVEHAVRQTVYDSLVGLSAALRPPPGPGPQAAARADAEPVYGTLRSAARSLLDARVDACCRQSMCRAVGLAAAALQVSTRPVFTVENFVVEMNEAAHFANLYCGGQARRVCAVLADIYGAVMEGDYHPGNVAAQMAVMEKCIRTAVRTLADARATGAQKAAARRTLLADLAGVCTTVRAKDHGCLDPAASPATVARPSTAAVHLTISPWRVPIRMYHQRSPVSVDQLLKTTVRLVETLVSEMFKPCLSGGRRNGRRRVRRQHQVIDDKRL